MKKIVLILILLCFVVGCSKEKEYENESNNEKEVFVLKKQNEDFDYIYFENYKDVLLGEKKYVYKYPVINIRSEEIENINLELKSFVVKSFKDANINDGILSQGNIIDYDYYVTSKYITVIQKYYSYIDGIIGEELDNVFVISLESGKLLSSDKILEYYGIDENKMFEMLRKQLKTEDVEFSIMNMKNEGYSLYINDDNKLVLIYYELTDVDSERKELVLEN